MHDTDDRTLDIEIAQLLGWRWVDVSKGVRVLSHPDSPRYAALEAKGERDYYDLLLPYSSDIGAAWVVVEYMRTQGWRFHLSEHGDMTWNCRFTPEDTSQYQYAVAPTAPLAICRAALRALEKRTGKP